MVQAFDDTRPRRLIAPSARGGSTGRIPPHNLEAEESLLGAMLLSRDAISSAMEFCKPEDFYKQSHGHIFAAITSLFSQGEPADWVTVTEELRRRDLLEKIGDPSVFVSLQANTPSIGNAENYAKIVEEHALLRRLLSVAGEITELGYSLPEDVSAVLDKAESLVFDVAQRRVVDSMTPLRDLLGQSLDHLEVLFSRGEAITGLATGYTDLDEQLAGLQPSNLIVVGARPAMGKTSFALGMVANAGIKLNKPVLLFSLEMSHLELTQRLLCSEAKVDATRMRTGKLHDADWTKIGNAISRMSEAPIFIDDNPNLTVMDIRARARRLKSREGLGLVVVDYLQLMTGRHGAENRQVEVSEISRGLKILARELEVPVVALSQLSRGLEMRQDKRPMLADLRESGCLTAETRVLRSDTGAEVSMGELFVSGETNIPVWTLGDDLLMVPATMSHVFASGVKPVFEMTMSSGKQLRASANHPFRTKSGWCRLDGLHPGDRLATPRAVPEPTDQIMWPAEDIVGLAHHLGHGGAHCHQGNQHQPISGWLDGLGLLGLASHELFVPRDVFRLSNGQLALFLQHLVANDGSSHHGYEPSDDGPGYNFASRGLADDVQNLWLRLGVIATIARDDDVMNHPRYHLEVIRAHPQRHGVDDVASLAVMDHRSDQGSHPQVTNRVMLTASHGLVLVSGGYRSAPTPSIQESTTMVLEGDQRDRAVEADVYWDQVLSIELVGEEPTYDATVFDTHNFVANGVVAHNSIEQDSDVVLFLYRDEIYHPDATENQGIAEIIVAKHRNGPTGVTRLAFIGQYARFDNMARM